MSCTPARRLREATMPAPPNRQGYLIEQVAFPTEQEMVLELERLSRKLRRSCREARSELGRHYADLKGYGHLIYGSRSCIWSSRELLVEVNERLRILKR